MQLQKIVAKLNKYHYLLFIIIFLTFAVRFFDLGYSTYYGDETKALYLDKTVSAPKFFLDQRKGPVQFAVAWIMETVSGGYDEGVIRIPFALAGSLAVLAFYLVVQKLFNDKVAFISTTLFSFNGFYIAFSRIVQYQSFLVLFGLLSIYFALMYYETETRARFHYLALSAIFLAIAYLSHYDAIFFDIAVGYILVKKLLTDKKSLSEIIKYFVVPFVVIVSLFYLPYIINGFMNLNTVNYMNKRISGFEYGKNSSWYTFWVYNPTYVWLLLSLFLLPIFFKQNDWKRNMVMLWFIIPFITFQFLFSNPGTHIHNYFLPLIILIALGVEDTLGFLKKKLHKQIIYGILLYAFCTIFVTSLFTFIPKINTGFPWKESFIAFKYHSAINKKFQLFLYGFPYERGWREIGAYIKERGGIRKIYTNDNDTAAQYYLRGIDYTIPGPNYLPEFYVDVVNNQEFTPTELIFTEKQMTKYTVEKVFYVEDELSAVLYKLEK